MGAEKRWRIFPGCRLKGGAITGTIIEHCWVQVRDRRSEWVMLYCLRRPCGVSDRPSAPLNSTCLSMLCLPTAHGSSHVPLSSLLRASRGRISRKALFSTRQKGREKETSAGLRARASFPTFSLMASLWITFSRLCDSLVTGWRSFCKRQLVSMYLPRKSLPVSWRRS